MLRSLIITLCACLSTACSLNSKPDSRLYNLRLSPGEDLRGSILRFVEEKQIRAGVVLSSVGSLTESNLRFANQKDSTKLKGPFEILALNGTVSINGSHLHLSIADGKGQSFGGHLTEGNLIYTTAELVIVENLNVDFKREHDPKTGFKELKILPRSER